MELLIKNARIIDKKLDFIGDLYIKDGKIYDYAIRLDYDCPTIDANGLCLMPAFIDMHVHFRDPGYTYKEDLETGGQAALAGGFTLVNLMANTQPICSSMETADYVLNKAKKLDLVDVHQCISITENFDGQTLSHLDGIDDRVQIISDDGVGVKSNLVMHDALLKAKERDWMVLSHAEDEDLTPIDYRLSENIISFRDIHLSDILESKLHLTHVSTKETIQAIRESKAKGNKYISCDITPHHMALWDSDIRVNPPIRQEEDASEIIKGIVDGTVDAIATDHAPHSKRDKDQGAPGFIGLETSFSLSYTSLVKPGHINMKRLSELMSARPGELMGVQKGKIKRGYDADLVLVDSEKEIKIDPSKFLSKSKNSPFAGKNLYGEIKMTIKDGRLRYSDGRIKEDKDDYR